MVRFRAVLVTHHASLVTAFMTSERYQQISKLLQAALQLEPQQRPAFLESACQGDPELRREVESLISSDERAGSFIAKPALEIAARLMDQTQTQLATEQKIGHYEIISLLGAGGMGEVYLARDTRLGRKVALKLLPSYFTQNADRLQRFKREASAASALNHPNILTIYEIGEADGMHFIATEFIEGETLRERMTGTPMNADDVLNLAEQIASALAAAHEAGIIHRDIKPENVMVRRDSIAKVLDFGLAKLIKQQITDPESPTQIMVKTKSGVVMGTVPYMSPEQALGRDVDNRSDLFSLGVLIYEMTTGHSPFADANPGRTLDRILHLRPESVSHFNPDMPGEMDRIVEKCLEKERERRYSSARELLVDLKSLRRALEVGVPAIVAERRKTRRALMPRRWFALSALLILVVVAALSYLLFSGREHTAVSPEIKSLAVLPLENLSGDATQEYFADGMTEAIISNLAKIRALRVVSRQSVMRFKGSQKDLEEIAQELKVDAVVVGSVQRVSGRVKVTAQLIDAGNDVHLWATDYERDLNDVLKLQSEVARAVATEIRVHVTAEERARLASAQSIDPEAHRAYLLGRVHLNKNNEQDWERAISYFQHATQIATDYAAAYAGLSDVWVQRGVFAVKPFKEIEPHARAAALEALRLNEQLPEAHIALGDLKFYNDWDWTGSEAEFKRALELDPGSLDAHRSYGHLLMALGRHDEAVNEGEIAAQLDPLTAETQTALGRFLYRARRYTDALPPLQLAVEREPRSIGANVRLADVYVQLGLYDEALAVFERGRDLTGNYSNFQAHIARVYALMGREREARQILGGLKVEPIAMAAIYTALGDKDEAFRILKRAIDERNSFLVTLKQDPPFDSLHSDPRWNALLRPMNFPPD